MSEPPWGRAACGAVGALLVLEALAMAGATAYLFLQLLPALASVGTHTGTAALPPPQFGRMFALGWPGFAMALAIGVAGWLLAVRKGRIFVVIVAAMMLVVQVALHVALALGFFGAAIIPAGVHLSAMALAIACAGSRSTAPPARGASESS